MKKYTDPIDISRPVTISFAGGNFVVKFDAMASLCEVLIDTDDEALAEKLANIAAHEAWRIEQKFSRYRKDGVIPRINNSLGVPQQVDEETAMLIDFSHQCYELSEGLFDITSGVLRKVWKFDGSDRIPGQQAIDKLIPLVGLEKTRWNNPVFTLPDKMEIDFGGIGKEYAVDRVLSLLGQETDVAVLVNFGGDIAASKPPKVKGVWAIGIEDKAKEEQATGIIHFKRGGIASSGDAKRYLLKAGKRYGHILNPKTGWPIANAPRAVTVLANTCTQAGILSSLAMMQGKRAKAFLEAEGVQFNIQR